MSGEGLYGSSTGSNVSTTFVAELVGTYLLVFTGTMVAVSAVLQAPIAGAPASSLAVALAFGLVLVGLVNAFGHISGCHLNPAVTIGLAASGRFPWKYVPTYVLAQLAGAYGASLTVLYFYRDPGKTAAKLGITQPVAGFGTPRVFWIEMIVTFILVFVIVAVATDKRVPKAAAGVAVGFALAVAILIAGPLTGGAVNPARALGPMAVLRNFGYWQAYVAGQLVGGIAATLLYNFLARAKEPSQAEEEQPQKVSTRY